MRTALLVLALAATAGGCGGSDAKTSPARALDPAAARFRPVPPSGIQRPGGAVSVFPAPGTVDVSPRTEISFRGVVPGKVGHVRVVGSRSGAHAGRLAPHRDGHGTSFVPARPFQPGEQVTVTTALDVRTVNGGTFSYTVARPAVEPPPKPRPSKPQPKAVRTFHTFPGLKVTPIVVTMHRRGTAPGLVFVAPKGGAGHDGLELLDSQGRIVWFSPAPPKLGQTDLRAQTYRGKPVITWWEGHSKLGHGYGAGVIADTSYRRIATVRAGDGYQADLHEFELTPRGTAFVTVYSVVKADLSSIGGSSNGVAIDGIVQEVEVGTGRVLFEWHSLGTVPLSDSYDTAPKRVIDPFDFIHLNSVTSDGKGDVLVSGRGTHTIYDLDGRTAQIRWKLGGKTPTVSAPATVATHSQHDAKWLDANTISIFDNGAGVGDRNHKRSRAIVVRLDPSRTHASLVADYEQPRGLLFKSQGDAQRLPNGNVFVGWGEGPFATEFTPSGKVVFSLHFVSGQSYRAYRFPWTARPATKPRAVVAGRTLYASWNGATQIARWEVRSGGDVVATARWQGLETAIPLKDASGPFEVRALSASGHVLASLRAG